MLENFFLAIFHTAGAVVFVVSVTLMLADPDTRADVFKNPRSYWK